nr:ankyrin repeat protein [Pandoravirus massiliensis]
MARNVNDAQGPFATMDIELWALVLDNMDRLCLPPAFFVSRRLRDAVRCRRSVCADPDRDDTDRDDDLHTQLPAYAVHHDYVASLIEARMPAVVRWAVDAIGCAMPPGMCRRIAATGDLALLKWARVEKGCLWDEHVFCAALMSGCVDVAKWLWEAGCYGDISILSRDDARQWLTEEMLLWFYTASKSFGCLQQIFAQAAAAIGSVECIAMIYDDGSESTIPTVVFNATRAGHIGMLDWLWERCTTNGVSDLVARMQAHDIVSYAATIKDADVRRDTVQWLVAHGWSFTTDILVYLTDAGDLQTLMWLWTHRDPDRTHEVWSSALYRRAAMHGHLCVVTWLDAVGVLWDGNTCPEAAKGGHLGIIKWAKSRGHPWRDDICDRASRGAHLDVLKWAYEKRGCSWSERARRKACTHAAKNNNFDAMRWAFARGSRLDEKTIIYAVYRGRVDMLDWIDAHATINWPSHHFLCGEALYAGHLDTIAWLRKRGVPWDYWETMWCNTAAIMRSAIADYGCPMEAAMCADAARVGDLKMLMWLRARGCPWDVRVCQRAARRGHLAVLQWIHTQGCPWVRDVGREALDTDPEVSHWISRQEDRPQSPV